MKTRPHLPLTRETLRATALLGCLLGACSARLAAADDSPASPWHGRLVYTVATPEYTTEFRALSDGTAWRYELGKGDPHRVWIVRPGEETITLEPLRKMYSVGAGEGRGPRRPGGGLDGAPPEGGPGRPAPDAPPPVPVGQAVIAGVECAQYHFELKGADADVWIGPVDWALPRPLFGAYPDLREVLPLLRGVAGPGHAPLRIERTNWRGKVLFRLELSAVESVETPASLFEVPADYDRGFGGGGGGPRGGGGPGGGGGRPSGPPPGGGGRP